MAGKDGLMESDSNPYSRRRIDWSYTSYDVDRSKRYFTIHLEKISPEFADFLCEYGFAYRKENRQSCWLNIESRIGYTYLSCLAQAIGESNQVSFVTGKIDDFDTATLLYSAVSGGKERRAEGIAQLVLSAYVPENINDLSIGDIVDFRQRCRDERIEFFSRIVELSDSLSSIDNKRELEDRIKLLRDKIDIDVRRLKEQFESQNISIGLAILSISVPTMITSISDAIVSPFKELLIGVGAGVGLAGIIMERNKQNAEFRKEPLSYCLSIDNLGNPKQRLKNKLLNSFKL